MKSSEKMLNWLRSQGFEFSDQAVIRRTYAGRNQRSAGAWMWYVFDYPGTPYQVGGYAPLSELLKCPKLEFDHHNSDGTVDCSCIGRCKGLKKHI